MKGASTTIHISKEYLHFSAAHFTIFSKTRREDLHGHTFYVSAVIDCSTGENGLAFDYNLVKTALKKMCDKLDEKVLLPEHSPFLELRSEKDYFIASFDNEKIPFLHRDVLTMPLRNITAEELSNWFLENLREELNDIVDGISGLVVRVSSGPGQWAEAKWEVSKDSGTSS
tara:strand:- start:878 stop:1390 length:513 start_codon:yes stop_codon:yes gene_type:complete